MQPSGWGQAQRLPVKDYFLMRVVKIAAKSAINKDTSTENTNTSNHLPAYPAIARDLIAVLSKTNESGCHELFPWHSMVMKNDHPDVLSTRQIF
jgi:hypothetical protein